MMPSTRTASAGKLLQACLVAACDAECKMEDAAACAHNQALQQYTAMLSTTLHA